MTQRRHVSTGILLNASTTKVASATAQRVRSFMSMRTIKADPEVRQGENSSLWPTHWREWWTTVSERARRPAAQKLGKKKKKNNKKRHAAREPRDLFDVSPEGEDCEDIVRNASWQPERTAPPAMPCTKSQLGTPWRPHAESAGRPHAFGQQTCLLETASVSEFTWHEEVTTGVASYSDTKFRTR